MGAWEIAARYSKIDLTAGTLHGGEFERWSGALSWRPTVNWRVEFNYGNGRLEKAGLVGRTNFYQLRLQFQL
jgi:phosphate-selective porin